MPGLALLGPTPHAVRLPAAVFGALSVPLLYGVAVLLLRSWRAGLCARLLAVSPWHLQFTRAAREASLLVLAILLLAYALLKAWHAPHGAPAAAREPLRRPGLPAGPRRLQGPSSSPRSSSSSWPAATGGASCGPPASGSRRAVLLVGAGLVPLGLQMLDGSARERLNQASIVNVPALRALSRERVTRDVQDGAPGCSTSPWRWACGGR